MYARLHTVLYIRAGTILRFRADNASAGAQASANNRFAFYIQLHRSRIRTKFGQHPLQPPRSSISPRYRHHTFQ
ncbi:Bgt-2532 [Blumeria graminis f. sp. tritici]|uniref:Bgt-2532 n=2 Tax=Blumeria graminis f. sp. tritici TaxID=62690 RepID=A0A061HE06_BLUGR|nr:hypothetical protein BGT96224_2532 [Blumeria graminis f. sp. tritici 96224]VCU38770.1 Bgt-2532 [Blumeria graminis f. sp. tritici]